MGRQAGITNGGFELLDSRYFPTDWSAVGPGVEVSPEARTGRYSMRIQRASATPMPPETGLNRAWSPAASERGSMLAEKRAVVRAWYRVRSAAPDAVMSLVVIPMGRSGIEDTGEPRAQRLIPNDAAGDGEWHETKLAYDYSGSPEVAWVHVGARIVGGAADLLLDDLDLLSGDLCILQLEKVHVYPDASQPDRLAMLTATVTNIGSGPSGRVRLVVELPRHMIAEGPADVGPLPAGGAAVARWRLRGPMERSALRITADDGSDRDRATARLAPRLELLSALASPGLVAPGGAVRITATVWNRGTASATGAVVRLALPAGVSWIGAGKARERAATLPPVPPGRRRSVFFMVRSGLRAGVEPSLACRLQSDASAKPAQAWPIRLIVTDAVTSARTTAVGPVVLRAGSDRTAAELVAGRARTLIGWMPHLGRVTVRLPSGKAETVVARYGPATTTSGVLGLISSRKDSAGGLWRFASHLQPLGAGACRITITASCSAQRQVLSFDGPTLLVGESSTGARKDEALFPGLEWLVGDEVSSGDLDIANDHPDRPRYAPHPNKVTIPAMAVVTSAGLAGLYWDCRDRWASALDRPQPVFASPDRIGGTAAHRLGLMAPSSAHGLGENAVVSGYGRGYVLAAGSRLRLSAIVQTIPRSQVRRSYGALEALAAWFRWFRPEPPAPAPRGSDPAQTAWSMQAYMGTLWDKEGRGWFPYLNGPAIWRHPSFDASFAYDLLTASRRPGASEHAAGWRDRVAEARAHGVTPDTMDGFAFAEGDPLASLRALGGPIAALQADQAADGSYAFDADRRDQGVFRGYDFHELGRPGEVECGLIARNAFVMLRAARLTGDMAAYRSGLKSLECVRRYRVPRAAQVWEVPVHTPDILAAADAVDAFIEAYRFSGDRRWLEDARRWAVAGLPFVYVWNAPDKLWMRYGSIPVFGASQMRGSWFGNVVQWNGLRFAAAILKLSEYDGERRWGGLTWRDIARGITRSAMYQQSTKPEIMGLWPDSLHTITGVRAAWDFAPRQILQNVWRLEGRAEEPTTLRVSAPGGRMVRLSAVGTVTAVRWRAGDMAFSLRHPAGMRGSVVVCGVTRPSAVRVGARAAVETPEGMRSEETCWRYDDLLKAVAVRVPEQGPVVVRLSGMRAAEGTLLPPVARTIAFEFEGDAGGWVPEHDMAPLTITDGVAKSSSTGGDPYMVRTNCRIGADTVRYVAIRIKASGGGNGQFYWTTSDAPAFSEERVLPLVYPADGQWHEVELPVASHSGWEGKTITGLRVDAINARDVAFAIDWIRGR